MVGNKWGFYDKGVKFRLTLCIFLKNNAFSIIMFRWPLSWCCHSSPFSFNEYNKQEWTSAICSCCHCLWTARCFRGVYFSFKPSFKQCALVKKKKVRTFLSALAFHRCFWHEKCCSTIKKKLHFQKYLGSKTPVKSQGSRNSSALGCKVCPWLYNHANPRVGVYWGNGVQVFSYIQTRRKSWPDDLLVWKKVS